jgi:hypothetical protein
MANNPNPRRIQQEADSMFRGDCATRLAVKNLSYLIGNPNFTSDQTLKAFQLAARALNKQTEGMIESGTISADLISWLNRYGKVNRCYDSEECIERRNSKPAFGTKALRLGIEKPTTNQEGI